MSFSSNPAGLPPFEQIVLEHQALVFRTLARLIGRSEQIEDLAQEVFFRLYRAMPGFRGEASLQTYLYRIVINVAHDERKRRAREVRRTVSLSAPLGEDDFTWESLLASTDPGVDLLLEEREFAEAVDRHLSGLSEVEQSVLVLYHQEDQTYEQISQTLAMPINTVRTHLHRGRKRLREAVLAECQRNSREKERKGGVQYAL